MVIFLIIKMENYLTEVNGRTECAPEKEPTIKKMGK